ncbi:FtsX-like permease family protein [Embleya sp. NPDC001921]
MLRLAFDTLRTRLAGFVGAFLAVALASVLITGAGVMLESALRTHAPLERLRGTDLAVAASDHVERTTVAPDPTGDEAAESAPLGQAARVPAELASRIGVLPGVAVAVPDRGTAVALPGGRVAHARGWDSAQLTPYRVVDGHAPQIDGQAAVDARTAAALGLRPGARLDLATPRGTRTVVVTGIAEGRGAPSVFLTPAQAAGVSMATDRADFIGVLLAPGVDAQRVRAAVEDVLTAAGPQFGDARRAQPRLQVVRGKALARLEAPAQTAAQQAAIPVVSVFGSSAAFAAIFVVAGTFGLSVRQRVREIGLLRAVGATPRQIRRMISAEALLVALGGSVIGVPLGYAFARVLETLFDRADALPTGFAIVNSWIPGVIGVGAAVATTQVAALVAAGRAAKVKPTEVFGSTGRRRILVPMLRYVLGLAATAGGVAVVTVSVNMGGDDGASAAIGIVFTFMIAVALLALPIARCGVAVIGRLFAPTGDAIGLLARANSAAEPGRVSAVAVPVALTVAFSGSILFIGTTVADTTIKHSKARTTATFIVDGSDRAGLPEDALARIRGLPGVAAASGTVATTVLDDSSGSAQEMDARGVGDDAEKVLDLGIRSGSLADLARPDTVALGSRHADAGGRHVGDRIRYWLGDGTPVEARVVAVYDNAFGFGDYLVPRELAAAHSTVGAYDKVYLTAAPGADRTALADALRREGRVLDRAAYLDEIADEAGEDAWTNALILGAIAVFTALGVVNTIVMATRSRSREFAVLRLAGTTPRQITAMLGRELAIDTALGVGLGTAIAWVTLGAFANGITGSFAPLMPAGLYLALVGVVVALVYGAGLLSVRSVLRLDPIAALGSRE